MQKTAIFIGLANFVCLFTLGWYCFSFTQRERIEVPQASKVIVPTSDSKSSVAMTVPHGMKPVYLTKTRVVNYLVNVPVHETHEKVVHYTVNRPVRETHEKVINYAVNVPKYETHSKVIPYTVIRYVKESEEQEDHDNEPASSHTVARPRAEQRTKRISYTTCRMVAEQRTKNVSYTTCKMVAEQRSKAVQYTTCKMVTQQRQKTVHYQTVEFEPITDSFPTNNS